ncbi:MAG TPA: hypothetical protein PLF81_16050 [Candidatus Anammoximicrobium sp.]|nr:hypothetical protein [Candidatus Anammoximicrobium sp.]
MYLSISQIRDEVLPTFAAWQTELETAGDTALLRAVAVWQAFPSLVGMIGNDSPNDGTEGWSRISARNTLRELHRLAVVTLAKRAEALGVDSTPILSAGQLCRKLYEADFRGWYGAAWGDDPPAGVVLNWPNCLGPKAENLEPHQRQTIDQAETALQRLAVLVKKNAGKKSRRKPGELNKMVLHVCTTNEESQGWSIPKWARELKAWPSQISNLPAIRALEKQRELEKIRRQSAKRRGRTGRKIDQP